MILSNNVDFWEEKIKIHDRIIYFKLDTGAQCNVLPLRWIQILRLEENVIQSDQKIITYRGNELNVLGYIILNCNVRGKDFNIKFLVADVSSKLIIGLDACVKLNLIAKVNTIELKENLKCKFVEENKSLFEGTGSEPFDYKIVLKQNYTPLASSCRRLPNIVKDKLKIALKNLEERGIIQKVNEPTEWVNNFVCVEKNDGSIRICLDPRHLNKYICLDQYPIPTQEEIANLS
ncbi:hypothetical protein QE152_g39749 [Popillia japonica]|uniref:Uncharacterized protein n=1 Tax=Popillia japonica TaxID=7064 RepID=A0AAW1HT88_POPJA